MKFFLLAFITTLGLLQSQTLHSQPTVVVPLGDSFYVIPTKSGHCNLPKVLYIDDVADSRSDTIEADPNGVQEIPILIGWKKLGFYDLVSIGVDGDDFTQFDTQFVQNLVNLSGDTTTVITGIALENEIISQAHSMNCPNQRLNIVLGGPWNVVEDAIDRAKCITPNDQDMTPIANCTPNPIENKIKVIGIGGSNVVSDVYGNRKSARDKIVSILGSNAVEITPTQFTRFKKPSNGFINYIDNQPSWYETNFHPTQVGDFIRNQGFDKHNIRKNYCDYGSVFSKRQWFCNNAVNGSSGYPNSCDSQYFGLQSAPYPPNTCIESNQRYTFAGADFTALAYVKWGASTFTMGAEMYSHIEAGLDKLPLKD